VVTARSKGLTEGRVIVKYPVALPSTPSEHDRLHAAVHRVGSIIVSLVLGLPTVGPLLLKALISHVLAGRSAHVAS